MKINAAAYADAAMHTECPHCGAPPHEWCTRADGHVRRVPCIARMRQQVADASPLYVAGKSQEGDAAGS